MRQWLAVLTADQLEFEPEALSYIKCEVGALEQFCHGLQESPTDCLLQLLMQLSKVAVKKVI